MLSLTTIAVAKPRSSQADKVFDTCKWAAEVQILKVEPSPGKGWPPSIYIRVSKQKSAIFFGQKPGASVTVHPLEMSHDSTLADLKSQIGMKSPILMVVNQDDRIEFVGEARGKKQRSYILRSWYDFNAWWIFSTDKDFGTKVEAGPMQSLELSAASIRARLAKRLN